MAACNLSQADFGKRPELLAGAVFNKDEIKILKKNSLLEVVEEYKNIQQ